MIRNIAIFLPEDEAQKAEHFAERLNMPLPAFCALAVTQLTEAYIEANHLEAAPCWTSSPTFRPQGMREA